MVSAGGAPGEDVVLGRGGEFMSAGGAPGKIMPGGFVLDREDVVLGREFVLDREDVVLGQDVVVGREVVVGRRDVVVAREVVVGRELVVAREVVLGVILISLEIRELLFIFLVEAILLLYKDISPIYRQVLSGKHNIKIKRNCSQINTMLKWEEKYLHPLVRSLKMDGPPSIVLLRGISGSGKSTLSNRLITLLGADKVSHCSADDYFIDENGDYHFDASKLPKAHKACIACLENALLTPSIRVIIVDNTHTRLWHMSNAEELAVKYGARIFVVEIVVPDQAHFSLCYQRQRHNVEKAVLYEQWIGWEKYLKPCIRVPMFVSKEEMGLL